MLVSSGSAVKGQMKGFSELEPGLQPTALNKFYTAGGGFSLFCPNRISLAKPTFQAPRIRRQRIFLLSVSAVNRASFGAAPAQAVSRRCGAFRSAITRLRNEITYCRVCLFPNRYVFHCRDPRRFDHDRRGHP
jgi:hypothetical protein